MQDDGESFANDAPEDLIYEVRVARFRPALVERVAELMGPGFDADGFANGVAEHVIGLVGRSGLVISDKRKLHARLGRQLDLYHPEDRARLANVVLVLLEEETALDRAGDY